MITRRQFNQGVVAAALGGLAANLNSATLFSSEKAKLSGDSQLIPDPNGILDLPEGFSYQVISKLDDSMNDGLTVPDRADGMGCIPIDENRVVLVRNHEIPLSKKTQRASDKMQPSKVLKSYDTYASGLPVAGGTSSLVYNLQTREVEHQCMSILGTIRNCSGGVTPWGSWLTCEESVEKASNNIGKDHGYVFEVPASARELVDPEPIKDMGRFNHEAACVDPTTGIVYLTEDRQDSLFYRYIPNVPGKLQAGGKLQALVVSGQPKFDTRNTTTPFMEEKQDYSCEWIDLDNVESPEDDLRHRGFSKGAALFARGEGIHFADSEIYFCCTSGGKKALGQIMRYVPTPLTNDQKSIEQTGTLSLFVESHNSTTFNYGDNLTVSPNGHLMVCEDQYTTIVDNHLKGVTPKGEVYDFAKVRWQTEPAGVCFSPDGSVLFVNLYSPTVTLAITGPWQTFYG
ncbi:MAG: alkaline phosphatase PhoX [Paraglaciecola sp.]|uniref:alkaline phosphatase PhoX n=1 Tax=Paraglaciecola sp. TaxID=1920173 RepID=UPI0032644FE2